MGHKLLAAATLMLVTTASAWAEPSESAIEDKRAATESVEIQQDNPLEALSGLSFAEKGQAMQMVRRELASLNQQLEILQEELQQQGDLTLGPYQESFFQFQQIRNRLDQALVQRIHFE